MMNIDGTHQIRQNCKIQPIHNKNGKTFETFLSSEKAWQKQKNRKRNKQIPNWDRTTSSIKKRFKIRLLPVQTEKKIKIKK